MKQIIKPLLLCTLFITACGSSSTNNAESIAAMASEEATDIEYEPEFINEVSIIEPVKHQKINLVLNGNQLNESTLESMVKDASYKTMVTCEDPSSYFPKKEWNLRKGDGYYTIEVAYTADNFNGRKENGVNVVRFDSDGKLSN